MRKQTRRWLAALLVALMLVTLCACNAKKNKKQSGDVDQPTAQSTYDALTDYAKRLEAAGNYEAAQRVYELIPHAMAGAATAEIEKEIADSTYGDYFVSMQNLEEWNTLIESVGDAK